MPKEPIVTCGAASARRSHCLRESRTSQPSNSPARATQKNIRPDAASKKCLAGRIATSSLAWAMNRTEPPRFSGAAFSATRTSIHRMKRFSAGPTAKSHLAPSKKTLTTTRYLPRYSGCDALRPSSNTLTTVCIEFSSSLTASLPNQRLRISARTSSSSSSVSMPLSPLSSILRSICTVTKSRALRVAPASDSGTPSKKCPSLRDSSSQANSAPASSRDTSIDSARPGLAGAIGAATAAAAAAAASFALMYSTTPPPSVSRPPWRAWRRRTWRWPCRPHRWRRSVVRRT